MRTRIATALATLALATGTAVAVLPATPASAAPICNGSTIYGGAYMPAYYGQVRCATQRYNASYAVTILQNTINTCYARVLQAKGLPLLRVDGSFGDRTYTALRAVQEHHRISVDGVYGPQTGNAMRWVTPYDACIDTPPF